jgi:hypothetical protein
MSDKKAKREDWLSPEERAALETLSADHRYRAEAKLLGDSIVESRQMLRRIFNRLKTVMEEYDE